MMVAYRPRVLLADLAAAAHVAHKVIIYRLDVGNAAVLCHQLAVEFGIGGLGNPGGNLVVLNPAVRDVAKREIGGHADVGAREVGQLVAAQYAVQVGIGGLGKGAAVGFQVAFRAGNGARKADYCANWQAFACGFLGFVVGSLDSF